MSAVPDVTDATFASQVLQSPRPVLVDYWADWCQPCKRLSTVIDQLASDYAGSVDFFKMDVGDVDRNTAVPAAQDVRNLPTVQLFVAGRVVGQVVGDVTKLKLRKLLEQIG
ncbi:MAG: thiol reductase thioredoxin [Propionibacteriaceae bacterium]|jgi:thioredoxin 1|nr:thiol reductase thioredoxin [Propionibacteriaceae bacterium]